VSRISGSKLFSVELPAVKPCDAVLTNEDLDWSTQVAQPRPETLVQVEYEHILKALKESGWIVGGPMGAAKKLGLKRTTLIGKMRKMRILRSAETVHSALPQSLAPQSEGYSRGKGL
jgi:transcriptional regulator with GAF, ATPase, and Fis domain